MKKQLSVLPGLLLSVAGASASAATSNLEQLAQKYNVTIDVVSYCLDQGKKSQQQTTPTQQPQQDTDKNGQLDAFQTCVEDVKKQPDIEVIVVEGQYIGLEVPEVEGRFHLDQQFIERAPKTTGDINDLIALLPGVQVSESASSASEAAEIRALQLSISGGQPWQTGFFIDGMNYNSRQDPNAYDRSIATINDVQGQAQTYNINSQIVKSIEVFDNNIPAEYGEFSGGVVSVESANAFDPHLSSFSFGVRGTSSDWGKFHLFEPDEEGNGGGTNNTALIAPVYDKYSADIAGKYVFDKHHGLMFTANYLKSEVSEITFGRAETTNRESANLMIKYSQRDTWIDSLDWNLLYAPYTNQNHLKDVLNSQLDIDGGGFGSTLNLEHDFADVTWKGRLQFNRSENSRSAPPHYYIWRQIKGREWGQDSDASNDPDSESEPLSLEGGYGNLDKTQTTITIDNRALFSLNDFLGADHDFSIGNTLKHEAVDRVRDQDSYYYNSAIQYSTEPGINNLNCNGHQLDCVELTFHKPLSALEAELGEPLDFTNIEHLMAYSDNIATALQYFQSRVVYGAEDLSVAVNRASLYLTDRMVFGRFKLNLGLRYDYDDFFKNHDIAPRISAGIDVFDDGRSLLVLGANRYYDSGLVTYKIKEEQTPWYSEYRRVNDGVVQDWIRSSADSDLRYRYENVSTPYDDEAVIGWKQTTDWFGAFSIKYVKRWKRDQLARAGESVLGEDGYRYAYQDNSGSGESSRLSLSWSAKYGDHSFWANTSFSKNERNGNDYDEAIDDVPIDELVWYEGQIITKSALDRLNANFGRPTTVNAGWTTSWTDDIHTSVTARWTEGYETAVFRNSYRQTDEIVWACPECEATNLLLPEYRRIELSDRWMVNASVSWDLYITQQHRIQLRADISNLFDARTYQVLPGEGGIEVGRQFWLGVKYDFE